jgi:hypothetical protein
LPGAAALPPLTAFLTVHEIRGSACVSRETLGKHAFAGNFTHSSLVLYEHYRALLVAAEAEEWPTTVRQEQLKEAAFLRFAKLHSMSIGVAVYFLLH